MWHSILAHGLGLVRQLLSEESKWPRNEVFDRLDCHLPLVSVKDVFKPPWHQMFVHVILPSKRVEMSPVKLPTMIVVPDTFLNVTETPMPENTESKPGWGPFGRA